MSFRQQTAAILGLTFAYAVARYVIFHDVAWANVPLYVLNKSVSWSGVIFFGMSLVASEKPHRRRFGTLSAVCVLAHIIMSLMVLEPAYFDKFYSDSGRFNFTGELSMLAGVAGTLGLAGLFVVNIAGSADSAKSLRAGWGRLVLWTAAIHVAVMGFAGWLAPSTWPAWFPPISLLSFGTALYFLYRRGTDRGAGES